MRDFGEVTVATLQDHGALTAIQTALGVRMTKEGLGAAVGATRIQVVLGATAIQVGAPIHQDHGAKINR